jgi:hypothetical protein
MTSPLLSRSGTSCIRAASAATELRAHDGYHLDALVGKVAVRRDVSRIARQDIGPDRADVVAVAPLLA